MRAVLSVVLLLLLCAGCSRELPLPGAGAQRKIVLLGELAANDTVSLRAGQSTPFIGGNSDILIEGLQMTITETGGAALPLSQSIDVNAPQLNTVPFSSPLKIQPGRGYRLAGRHAVLGEVSADVSVPGPFAAALRGSRMVSFSNDSALRLDIEIDDAGADSAFYTIEAFRQILTINTYFRHNGVDYLLSINRLLYDSLRVAGVSVPERSDTIVFSDATRVNLYATDALVDNAGASAGKQYKRILLQGKSFGGRSHATQLFISRQEGLGYFGQPVRVFLYVRSVDAAYYTFLKAYDQNGFGGFDGGSMPPSNVPGNVRGGLGMVGGAYRIKFSIVQ